jgi:glycosyltransferase involved in cell wall biosynthesis
MLISIVIPIHNEEQNLQMLLPVLWNTLDGIAADFEVLLVDDASTDNSRAVAEGFCKDKPNWQTLPLPARGGHLAFGYFAA